MESDLVDCDLHKVPYANSWVPDETPILLSSGSKLFDTLTTFSETLREIEAL